MKKITQYVLVIVCLVPLFFINIRTSHDWGDDFAQYIHQAKNIVEGISQNETGYIFNENCFTGPQAYPTGFPLLLSPVIKSAGIDYRTLDRYMTLFLALTCFTGFLILRRYTAFITAFATTLIVAYNPVFLYFKTEVLSDLPFAFFSMLCIYFMLQKENIFLTVLLGLLMGFSIHIRSVGFLLVAVFVVNKLFLEKDIREFSVKKNLHTAIALVLSFTTYFLIKLAFPCDSNYPSILETDHFWNTVNDHLSYNVHHLSWMFRGYMTTDYFYIGVIASSCLIVFSVLGFIHFFKSNKRSLINVYVVAYLFAVISYKYSHAGMRFLYPILFFIFLYAIIGLKQSLAPFMSNNRAFAAITGLIVLFSYKDEVVRIVQAENNIIDGPQLPEAQAIFKFINDSTPPNSIIEFDKPRVLTLYTHARSFAFNPSVSAGDILSDLKKFNVKYILTSESQSTENIRSFPLKDTTTCKQIYSKGQFRIYSITQ